MTVLINTQTDFYSPVDLKITPNGDHFAQQDEEKHTKRRRPINSTYTMSSILESEVYMDSISNLFPSKMKEVAIAGKTIDLSEWISW